MISRFFPNSIKAVERCLRHTSHDADFSDRDGLLNLLEASQDAEFPSVSYMLEGLENLEAHTAQTLSLLEQSDAFSTVSLCAALLALFGFDDDQDSVHVSQLLVAAVLADVPNDLPYHNNKHFRKVVLHAARMMCAHNYIFDGSRNVFSKADIVKLLVAACIHDLGHDGAGNIIDRTYHMALTEKRSFDLALPYLEQAGVPELILNDIRVMLIGTDASPFGDPVSPSQQIRRSFAYHFGDDDVEGSALELCDSLSMLEEREDLSLMCMVLHEADLMNSIGLDYSTTIDESVAVSLEIGGDATPEGTLLFLEKSCCNGLYTDSGRYLGQQNFEVIRNKILQDYKDGNKVYRS